VGNTSLSAGDSLMSSILQKDGFTATTRSATSAQSADASDKTVVVISESVTSTDVLTKFRDTSAGVTVNELALFDDMNMTTGSNLGISNETALDVAADVVGRGAGWLGVVQGTGAAASFGWGVPAASATIYASNVATPSHKLIFYYAAGSPMVNNFTAPGRRVGTCFTDAALGVASVVGQRLLEESILLAAGPTAF
jgi:hypothetical protein